MGIGTATRQASFEDAARFLAVEAARLEGGRAARSRAGGGRRGRHRLRQRMAGRPGRRVDAGAAAWHGLSRSAGLGSGSAAHRQAGPSRRRRTLPRCGGVLTELAGRVRRPLRAGEDFGISRSAVQQHFDGPRRVEQAVGNNGRPQRSPTHRQAAEHQPGDPPAPSCCSPSPASSLIDRRWPRRPCHTAVREPRHLPPEVTEAGREVPRDSCPRSM